MQMQMAASDMARTVPILQLRIGLYDYVTGQRLTGADQSDSFVLPITVQP